MTYNLFPGLYRGEHFFGEIEVLSLFKKSTSHFKIHELFEFELCLSNFLFLIGKIIFSLQVVKLVIEQFNLCLVLHNIIPGEMRYGLQSCLLDGLKLYSWGLLRAGTATEDFLKEWRYRLRLLLILFIWKFLARDAWLRLQGIFNLNLIGLWFTCL